MKRLLPLGMLVLTAGCAALFGPPAGIENPPVPKEAGGGPAPSPQLVGIQADIEQLKYVTTGMKAAVEKMESDHRARIEAIERRLTQVESAAARLIQHLEILSKTPQPPPGGTKEPKDPVENPNPNPTPNPTPIIDTDALLAEATGKMRKEMRAPDQEELASKLAAVATAAVPRLVEELKVDPTHIEYSRNFQAIVSKLPTSVLAMHFKEALGDPRMRGTIAEAIGRTGDKVLGGLLLDHATTSDETFRSQVAEGLTRCRHSLGVALLISQLSSTDETLRMIAILTLKKLNGGHAMGFDARIEATNQPNVDAIKRWNDWYNAKKETLFKD